MFTIHQSVAHYPRSVHAYVITYNNKSCYKWYYQTNKMPWEEIHKLDNDGNTVVIRVRSRVNPEDVLREFRKRNSTVKSNSYVREIQSQLPTGHRIQKKKKKAIAESNISDNVNSRINKGVWSKLTKPYKPAGDMTQHDETKTTYNKRIQRMKTIYKKRRYDKIRKRQEQIDRNERMKKLNPNRVEKRNINDFEHFTPPSQEEFIIKSRSIRIDPSIFPSDLLSDSKEFKNQIQCGQSYDNGMKMIHHKIKNMYPLLQLEPKLSIGSEVLPEGQNIIAGEDTAVLHFNVNMDEIALDMKNKTNGKIMIEENVKPNDDLIHLLTADAGINAKRAAMHTEKCRVNKLKKLKKSNRVFGALKKKKDKIQRKSKLYVSGVRKKCQNKVEYWMDSFKSTGNMKDKILNESLTLRKLDQVEVAHHVVKDFDSWGFETGPSSLSPSKKKKRKNILVNSNVGSIGNNSSMGLEGSGVLLLPGGNMTNMLSVVKESIAEQQEVKEREKKNQDSHITSFWNQRRFEVVGILEDCLIGKETTKIYRDLLVFTCLLEGENSEDEFELIQFLRDKFESGVEYNKLMFCEAWHVFSSRVPKNLRLAFVFKYLYNLLEIA